MKLCTPLVLLINDIWAVFHDICSGGVINSFKVQSKFFWPLNPFHATDLF